MRTRTFLTTLLAALLAPAIQAQVVSFSGIIEKYDQPSICQEQSHRLTCNGAWLKSNAVDLKQFEGTNATFTALKRGVTCTVYDVLTAQDEAFELIQCGSPVPGCKMRFKVAPSGMIGQAYYFYSLTPGLLDLGGLTLLLGTPFYSLGSAPMGGLAPHVEVTLPANPGLTGAQVYLQAVWHSIGPVGPLHTTNATCFTILGPSPPCQSLGC